MSDHAISGKQASSTPQNSTPFQSLFLSLTRPFSSESISCNPYTPYLVLFQHNQHLIQRLIAAEPDQSAQLYKNAGLLTPKETSVKDGRADLFVKEAWRECVKRCSGRVIVVKCSQSIDFGCDKEIRKNRKNRELDKLFGENGVVVDLFSDPLGWDADFRSDANVECSSVATTFKAQATKLQSVLLVLQEAAQYISSQTSLDDGTTETIQPIPIIFDSITPLLLHHGVEKVTMLFSRLKQSVEKTIISPIFVPTLTEILPSSGNKILEEYADAILTLNGGKLTIAKRSARVGGMVCGGLSGGLRLTKDHQHFEIEGNGNNSNGLVLLKKGMESSSKVMKEEKNDLHDIESGAKRLNLSDNTSSMEKNSTQRPILQHEEDKSEASNTKEVSSKPAPRIFLEENDPEFHDLDEEDPDDDLDI
jgi:hypothetical protein